MADSKIKYRRSLRCWTICYWFMMWGGCHTTHNHQSLTIAASANMQYAIEEIAEVFYNKYGVRCHTIISSSGKLTAQILSGAPYDLFFSADTKYPAQLLMKGLTIDTPRIYALGHVALWSLTLDTIEPSQLRSQDISHLAIANPKTAPYGVAAQEVLRYYDMDHSDAVIVFGESISQVNQFVLSQAVDVGITSLSIVLSPLLRDRGTWVKVGPEAYTPIEQSMTIVSTDTSKIQSARLFRDFIDTPVARQIMMNYGFTIRSSE